VDVYDTVSRSFLKKGARNTFQFTIGGDAARVLVLIPAGKKTEVKSGSLWADNIPVDFRFEE
jgi:hypothetical protein